MANAAAAFREEARRNSWIIRFAAVPLGGLLASCGSGSGDAASGGDAEVAVANESPVTEPVEDLMSIEAEPEFVPDPSVPELTIDKSAEVAILGYHDFTDGVSRNPMVINIEHFRRQLQALADAGLPVVSMDEFLAWRRGEREIPANSVMITIDDGWKSTYQLAFPVLKEFGYPFTIFLYSRYVNGGGRALTIEEIEEMRDWGATIGSHSFSHPLPGRIRTAAKGKPEDYDAFLMREMAEPRKFLEEKFTVPVNTYAYPGGMMTERMVSLNEESVGYEAMFTCNPAKTTWDTPMPELNRYIVYGDDESDANFRLATTFSSTGVSALDMRRFAAGEDGEHPVIPVEPADQSTVSDRQPEIRVDLSEVEGVLPESLRMRVSGFGDVPATFDPAGGTFSYRPRRVIREENVAVSVQFLREGQETPEMVGWRFGIDRLPLYIALSETEDAGDGDGSTGQADPAVDSR